MRIALAVGVLGLAAAVVAAPEAKPAFAPFPHPKGYVCRRAAAPPVIDGKLDDPAWAAAAWTDPFVDIEGGAKPKPRHRTRVKMLWDDEALYIAAELEEPHVWGTLKEHDSVIFYDPDFEVFLDPDGDNHLYAELELNALNTTWDLLLTKPYKDDGHAVNAWEITGLKTAVRVTGTVNDPRDTDTGWAIEIKWPWVGLKELLTKATPTPPRDGDRWRINFSRVEWDVDVVGGKYQKVPDRKEHNWVWSPQGAIDMHRPERWGYLQFTTAEPGTEVAFAADPDWATRDLLHRVYYAQRDRRLAHKPYAATAKELGIDGPVTVETTRGAFEATAGKWTINQDSWLRAK